MSSRSGETWSDDFTHENNIFSETSISGEYFDVNNGEDIIYTNWKEEKYPILDWLDGLLELVDHDLRLATFIHSYIEMAIKYFEPYSNPRYAVLTSNGQWRAERNRNRKFWVVCVP